MNSASSGRVTLRSPKSVKLIRSVATIGKAMKTANSTRNGVENSQPARLLHADERRRAGGTRPGGWPPPAAALRRPRAGGRPVVAVVVPMATYSTRPSISDWAFCAASSAEALPWVT